LVGRLNYKLKSCVGVSEFLNEVNDERQRNVVSFPNEDDIVGAAVALLRLQVKLIEYCLYSSNFITNCAGHL
jgi:hypothetical protein